MYEIEALISNIHLKSKNDWEQARLVAYITAQVNSTKKLKPTDILKFNWDDAVEKTGETSISNQDVDRLNKKMQNLLNSRNNGK